jgi:hypothetical protein
MCRARLEDEKQCILVLIGAAAGREERTARLHRRRELLLDLKNPGLAIAPKLAIADGALGFWKAIGEVWPDKREQRCWVHKTSNVLPKSQQPKAKRALQEIWMAETRKDAETAFDAFITAYQLKYEKAAACLAEDRESLLVFYDFPAEHWKHLRTSNPIESTFAKVRHRPIRSKGCLSNTTALAIVFKLIEAAQKKAGAASTDITSCRKSFSAPSSATYWRSKPPIINPKPPPESGRPSPRFGYSSMATPEGVSGTVRNIRLLPLTIDRKYQFIATKTPLNRPASLAPLIKI